VILAEAGSIEHRDRLQHLAVAVAPYAGIGHFIHECQAGQRANGLSLAEQHRGHIR